MPKRAQYSVSWSPERDIYLVKGPEGSEPVPLAPAWFAQQRAFAFHGRNGRISLLKEKRKRGDTGYWYAYRRHQKKMLKRYVGPGDRLNVEQLEEIAQLLTNEMQAEFPATVEEDHASKQSHVRSIPSSHPPVVSTDSFMVEPLLMSRLQVPRLQKGLLAREHLLELLDQCVDYRVTLVSGPAGYGKTTLLGQWIAARHVREDVPMVAWVTLDEGDNDQFRFWRYLIAACQQFAPDLGEDALNLLLAHRLPSLRLKPLEIVLVALLNALGRLEHPAILILDELHVIRAPQVSESLGFFLEHLPATLHLVLLMRGDPPFSMARLRARNELLDIAPPDLGFSLEETRAFLEQELSFPLAPRVVRRLYQRLEGWPAGLRLFIRGLSKSVSEQEIEALLESPFFADHYWNMQDYFLGEVLPALSAEQQEFLLQTSLLPRVTAELCAVLTGCEESAHLLATLREGDFFLIPLDGSGEWVRYHPLFAEVMQQEARRRLGDARFKQLARAASMWYEARGLLAEAIDTAFNAADVERAAGLIARWIEIRQQKQASTFLEVHDLQRWLESLPETELRSNPEFCLHYAMILLFLSYEGPRRPRVEEQIHHLLQVAEQKWRDANNTAKLAEVFAFRAMLARQEGHLLQSVTWARQALAWLPPLERTWRTIALSTVGIGEVLTGSLAQARAYLLEARELNAQLGNATYGRAIRGMLSGVSLEQGTLRHAAEDLRQMQAEARVQEDRDDIARTQMVLARILYQWNQLDEAEQAVREVLTLGEQMHEEEFLCSAALRLAWIAWARGQDEQAQQYLRSWLTRTQATISGSPQMYQYQREVHAALAHIQLAGGDLAAVRLWYADLEQQAEMLPLSQRRREQLLAARFLLAQGEDATAQARLEELLTASRQTGHVLFGLTVQVVLALTYARRGDRERARTQLLDVLMATHSEGYIRLFLDEGTEMATLLRELLPRLHSRVLQVFTRRLLAAFAETDADSLRTRSSGQVFLTEPLSFQEQKVLRLLVMGNSNAEIARELVVSVNTVRTQVQSIYRKLNVNNRVQASTVARYLDLLA